MRTTLRFAAFLACSVLVACSSEDSGTAPEDTGSVVDDTAVDSTQDTGSPDTGSADDSSMAETSSDTGGSTDTGADSVAADSTTDATSDAASETSADAGGETATGKSCTASGTECSATEYCDAPTCASGTCKPRPISGPKTYEPVCGCDGVTYWNKTLASSNGQASYAGKCAGDGSGLGPTKFCGLKGCDPDEACIQDLTDHGSCGLGGFGKTCWRLIPGGGSCPATAMDTPKVRGCSGGTPGTCMGYCRAIVTEDMGDITGFLQDGTCP